MKNVVKVVLLLIVVGLAYISYRSIMNPIEFESIREMRDKAVIARLIDIKKAQVEFRNNNGRYAATFDTLIDFVKNTKMSIINKEYELNDKQLEKIAEYKKELDKKNRKKNEEETDLTIDEADRLVLDILAEAKSTGKWEKVNELNALSPNSDLRSFRRDTSWVSLADTLYHNPEYPIDSLQFVPFGNGSKFTLLADSIPTKSGGQQHLFEARADFEQYLTGINDQEYDNYILRVKKIATQVRREPVLDKDGKPKFDENEEEVVKLIPCRRVGNVKESNNNAGNWE